MESNEKIKRIAEIISYILQLLGGKEYSKTKIVKLLYMLDVCYSKKYKKSFTEITFKSYFYGPYSSDIEDAIELLINLGCVSVNRVQSEYYNDKEYYIFKLNSIPDFGLLKNKDKRYIQIFLQDYLHLSLSDLLDRVYETEEYKKADFGDKIRIA